MAKLTVETWHKLIQATEDLASDKLQEVLEQTLGKSSLSSLSEEQGQEVLKALDGLDRIRGSLINGAVRAMHAFNDSEKAGEWVTLNPDAVGTFIASRQSEALLISMLESDIDKSLFEGSADQK